MKILPDRSLKQLKILLVLSILLTISLLYVGIVSAAETGPKPDLTEAYLKGSKPANMQQKIIPVESWKKSHLVATLYQYDSMEWYYDLAPITYGPFKNIWTKDGDVPERTDVDAVIEVDCPIYDPNDPFKDKVGNKYPIVQVPSKNRDVGYIKSYERDIDTNPPTVTQFVKKNKNFSTFMRVGGSIDGDRKPFVNSSKSSIAYYINLDILWQGTVVETTYSSPYGNFISTFNRI